MLSTAAHNTGGARSACNDPCPSIAPQSTALWWHEPARQITYLLEAAARYSSLHSAGRTPGAAAVLQITTSDTAHNAYMAMGSAANSALQSAPSNSIAPCNQIKPRTAYAASLCCSLCCKHLTPNLSSTAARSGTGRTIMPNFRATAPGAALSSTTAPQHVQGLQWEPTQPRMCRQRFHERKTPPKQVQCEQPTLITHRPST